MKLEYKQFFGCESTFLLFRYLGVPIHCRKLRNFEWNPESHFFCKARMPTKVIIVVW
jgi:hypothetical protein